MPLKKTNSSKSRLNLITTLMLLICFTGLIVRLAYIQIIRSNEYMTMAEKQHMTITQIKPKRGSIYDRNMTELVKSANVWNVILAPKNFGSVEEKKQVANDLAEILNLDKNELQRKIAKENYYEIIKRNIEKPEADKIRKYKKENNKFSIYLEPSEKRYYLRKNLLSHVLGFVGYDNVGLEGLENRYEDELSGFYGKTIGRTNALGRDMATEEKKVFEVKNGNDLVLTIDANIQSALEKHIEDAIEENNVGNGAVGIVMDVTNGEILAMTTKPDYDPNEPFKIFDITKCNNVNKINDKSERLEEVMKCQRAQWRNKAVSDLYEPGSTFKIISAASFLEEGTARLSDTFNCTGSVTINDKKVACWVGKDGHGHINFENALVHSCNPSFINMGLKLGQNNFIKYFEAFGFKELTGIDLPGESNSIFHSRANFNNLALGVSSMGQTFKSTPIQTLTGIAAAINGGKVVKPYIVKRIIDENKNVVKENSPVVKRTVISQKVSRTISQICEKVVSEAGGRQAYRTGHETGGKTGTAEKIDKQIGGKVAYYTLSFVAFTPIIKPQIAVFVLLDEPRVEKPWGSVVAVPVVGKVLDYIYKYKNIEQTHYAGAEHIESICIPNLNNTNLTSAKDILRKLNLRYKVIGNNNTIIKQMPVPGIYVPQKSVITLYTEENAIEQIKVPNVVGKTLTNAKDTLEQHGLNYTTQDSNQEQVQTEQTIITKQTPEANECVAPGSFVELEFVYRKDININ